MPLKMGASLGPYAIESLLGAGGMGEVYRAVDTRLGRPVALKFISAPYQNDPDRRARLLQEARAASLLRSPAIATTYDIGEHDGLLFIVMELVEGELLSTRLARGPLPVGQGVEVAEQVADALDEAHGLGIVHRDIKSGNLVLTERGFVKILDFGLAKFIGVAGGPDQAVTLAQTMPGALVGTISYMSPEQALGRTVDHRSDLFSLGVVIYEMLTGSRPFTGPTLAAVIEAILHQQPAAIARAVSPRIGAIVHKLLAKDPIYRYQRARDLLIDLRASRLELDGMTSAFGLAITSLAETARTTAAPAAVRKNTVAVLPFTNITREPADDWIGSGIAETVTADLKTIHGLLVLGRERVFDAIRDFGSTAGPLDDHLAVEVGRRLRATWLVTGGYQRLGGHIRITARFAEVESGTVIRTVKIDGAIEDIFTLQDKIVYELSQGMNLTLHDSEVAEIERRETASVEAYENRSRAIMNLMEGSPQALDRAILLLERATAVDPHYAAAWAALGAAYDLKGSFLGFRDLSLRAIDFERKAISLNPRLAEAYRWLGLALLPLGRFDEAVAAGGEAIRLDPDDAAAHAALARALWVGKGQLREGIAELERAIALNPELGWAYLQLGLLYTLVGDYPRGEAACHRAIEAQQRYVSAREGLQILGAYTRLGYVYYRQGRYRDAIAVYEQQAERLRSTDHALKERAWIELHQKLGAAYHRLGLEADAERHFEQAVRAYESRLSRGAADPFTTYYIACVHGLRGDVDRAVRCLEETFELLPALNRVRARTDPDFDAIRHHPRFAQAIESGVPGPAALQG